MKFSRVLLKAATAATAVAVATSVPAVAQTNAPSSTSSAALGSSTYDGKPLSSIDPAYDIPASLFVELSKQPGNIHHLNNIYRAFHRYSPDARLPIPNIWGTQTPYTQDKERDFAEPKLIKREPDERFDVERLYIESPAMRRVVQVQIQYPKDRTTPAPMLYMLDGVSAPRQSGWLREGDIQGALANEHVTAVMPTEAMGTNYTDWVKTHPYIGRAKWETFMTKELPKVLETQTGIPFNGERYIGGLSMGGSGAARLANLHPDLYSGVFVVSGCYATTNTVGREFFNFSVMATGGNPDYMWGRGDTPERIRADIVRDPRGIASMPAYFFASDGAINPTDYNNYRSEGAIVLMGASVLEIMSGQCTKDLENSIKSKGLMTDKIEFDYQPGNIHDWPYYKRQMPVGWQSITKGKYTYR